MHEIKKLFELNVHLFGQYLDSGFTVSVNSASKNSC